MTLPPKEKRVTHYPQFISFDTITDEAVLDSERTTREFGSD